MKKLLLAAAAFAVSGTAHAAELLTNGGFEAPVVTTACCTTTPPAPLPGWTVPVGDVNVVNGTFFGSPPGTNLAFEGTQYLDLIGQSGAGSLMQSFATTAGFTYVLSFAYSHNLFPGGTGSASAAFNVGSLADVVSHSTGSTSNLDWQTYTSTFTAVGPTTTLSFVNLTGTQNAGLFLDAVSVDAAVPEPSTWAMMILGFGLLAGFLRRRRRPALSFA